MTKEDIWTRYFFFFEDGLYKMFLGVQQGRASAARASRSSARAWRPSTATRERSTATTRPAAASRHKLDHYEWSAGGGDRLRLVDRSEFYGVYCLVLYDGSVQDRVDRAAQGRQPRRRRSRDELVEAVTGKDTAEGLGHRRRHHRSRRRQGGQEAGHRAEAPGHRRRRVQSAQGDGRVVGLGLRREEEGDEQQERSLVVLRGEGRAKKKGGKKRRQPDGRVGALVLLNRSESRLVARPGSKRRAPTGALFFMRCPRTRRHRRAADHR